MKYFFSKIPLTRATTLTCCTLLTLAGYSSETGTSEAITLYVDTGNGGIACIPPAAFLSWLEHPTTRKAPNVANKAYFAYVIYSPLLESYKKNDIEVLILDDKEIDEIITPAIGAYKEWEFKDITACEPPKVEQTEEEKKEVEEKFQDVTKKIKDKLGDAVKDVKVTNRLSESPSCVVKDAADAQMAAMAHMFRAMGQAMPESAPILEINPDHETVKKLNGCPDESTIEDVSWILLDQALLS